MPVYDFRCEDCDEIEEVKIRIDMYDQTKDRLCCSKCHGILHRMVDFKGCFETKGAGWFGKDGTGTGYEITQNEMDKNGDNNKFLEEKMS